MARLEAIYDDRDMRGLNKHLKKSVGLAGRSSRVQQFVLDESGVVLRKKADVNRRWERLFSTLLDTKSPSKLNPATVQNVTQHPARAGSQRLNSAPTMDETRQAVCRRRCFHGRAAEKSWTRRSRLCLNASTPFWRT